MRRIDRLAAGVLLACAAASAAMGQPPRERPRLLVLIVADQMSDDLLDRYGPHLSGGFRRLLDQGRRFEDAVVDHAPTNSLPGHLTVATGAHPRRHGIVDNSWIEIQDGEPVRVLGFSDPDCPANPVRGTLQSGTRSDAGMGPGRFESATIVEWVLGADPIARFASVGTGGGVSVLHAGKVKGPVLWYDAAAAGYVTSSCYASAVPDWAAAVNGRLESEFMASDWTLQAPAAMAKLADPDEGQHENGGRGTVFPHPRPAEAERLHRWFLSTPFADSATLALAEAAVVNERLGEDAITDILTIGLSTLDHVGHSFGPTSLEQADTLFLMDRRLGEFFDFLDRRVGRGRWAVALTADHGAPPAPEVAGVAGARRVSEAEASAATDSIVAAAERRSDRQAQTAAAAEAAAAVDFVARVITPEDRAAGTGSADPVTRLYANSYWPGRTSTHPLYESESERSVAEFGIIVVPHPYVVVDWAASIHGSPYAYDREVEMLFYGPGVTAGTSLRRARTVDAAPTLARIAGIAPIGPIDGKPLELTD